MIKLSLKMGKDSRDYFGRTLGNFRFFYNHCIDIFLLDGRMPTEEDLNNLIKDNVKQFSHCALLIAKEKALALFHEDRVKSNNFSNVDHQRIKDLYLTRNDVDFLEFTKECSTFGYIVPESPSKGATIILNHKINGKSFFNIDPIMSLKDFREQFSQCSLDILSNLKFDKITLKAHRTKAKGYYLILE